MRNLRIHSPLSFLIIAMVSLHLAGNAANSDTLASDTSATQPTISHLEVQIVFPGADSQGQIDTQVRPGDGCELLTLRGLGGTKIAALFGKSTAPHTPGPRPALLFFYGNGMCMAYSAEEFDRFRSLGFHVMMVDYPGYGMSAGTPGEPGCYAAADAAYDYLLTRDDVDHNRLVATGWSLGAGVAIDLASRRHVAGLATFSAFTNTDHMRERIAERLPVGFTLSSQFDNLNKIAAVSCPVFMAHGTQDQLVPIAMLDSLTKAAKSKVTIVRIEGAGHNDIFRRGDDKLFQQLKTFVDGLAEVVPSTRPTASATTKPILSNLEIEMVFPGYHSQGQPGTVVRPGTGCELLTLHGPDGTKITALFGKNWAVRASTARPALLLFYGNAMCMASTLDQFDRFRRLGFNVIMADYEGYGMSGGKPSETGCYAAAAAIYDYLLTRKDIDRNRLVPVGVSLGAAVAIDLASRRSVAGLATCCAFTKTADVERSLLNGFPPLIQPNSEFDNLAKIGTITCPIFMAHGTKDQLVSPAMLDRLAKAAKSKVTILRVAGAGHNDFFQGGGDAVYQRLKMYVDGLAGVPPTTRPQ